jgi:hypothetical protein
MDTANILMSLRAERDRLTNAIAALEGGVGNGRRGRPPGRPPSTQTTTAPNGRRPRRKLSAAAKKRIAEGMRKRWAAAKKAGKSRLG